MKGKNVSDQYHRMYRLLHGRFLGVLSRLMALLAGVFFAAIVAWLSYALIKPSPILVKAQELSTSSSVVADLGRFFVVNVPSFFKELVTFVAIEVEGESIFGGDVIFESGVVFDGQITLNGNAFGQGINIDLGGGEITASNVLYSLVAGDGISISSGQNPTITNSAIPGLVKSGTYAVLASSVTRVGIGTSTPGNTVEIASGTSGTSGLTFTNLTSASSVGVGGGKVLSVDSGGNVILVTDESGGVVAGDLDSALPGGSTGSTIYFDGSSWAHTTNLYHNGGQVGISTIPGTNIRFDVKTNATTAVGMVIRRVSSQTANLFEFRNESDSILSYFDKDGVFNGSIAGGVNPNLTTGSVVFQGASGLTQDNSNFFWDDTNNRLGLGTTSPASPLHLIGNGQGSLRIDSTTESGIRLVADSAGTSDTWYMLNSTSGTLIFQSDGTSNPFQIEKGTPSNTLYLDSTGSVGLGTNNPDTILTLQQDFSPTIKLSGTRTADADFGELQFYNRAGAAIGGQIIATRNGANNTSVLRFTTNNAGTLSEKMRIDNAGNVGIGTTSPGTKLEVVGDIRASNNSKIGFNDGSGNTHSYLQGGSNTILTTGGGGRNIQLQATDASGVLRDKFIVAGLNSTVGAYVNYGNFGIGTTSPTSKLHVSGAVTGKALVAFNETGDQDIFTASASGTTRLVLTNAGDLGIGTTTPASKLDVYAASYGNKSVPFANIEHGGDGSGLRVKVGSLGSGTQEPFSVYAGSTALLKIDGAGNLGIGTATPDEKLHVLGSSAGDGAHIANAFIGAWDGDANYAVFVHNTAKATTTKYALLQSNTGDATLLNAGTTIGFRIANSEKVTINSSGSVGIGTTSPGALLSLGNSIAAQKFLLYESSTTKYGMGIQSGEMRLFLPHNAGTGLTFGTLNSTDGSTWTERMRMTPEGNFGIGATSPGTKLTLSGSEANNQVGAGDASALRIINTNGAATGRISELQFSNYALTPFAAVSGALVSGASNSTGNLIFSTRNAATDANLTERMTILSGGNVGIGTTSPDTLLTFPSSGSTLSSTPNRIQLWDGLAYGFGMSTGSLDYQSAGKHSFYTSGTVVKMTLDSIGNLGIGTSSPTSPLHVNAGYGANALATFNQLNSGDILTASASGVTKLTINSLGQFVPDSETRNLTASGNITAEKIWPRNHNFQLVLNGRQVSNTSFTDPHTLLRGSFVPTTTGTNKYIGTGVYVDINQTGGHTGDYTAFQVDAVETSATGTNKLLADFKTGGTSMVSITSSGRLGIGTVAPGALLDVNGDAWFNNGANRFTSAGLTRIGGANHYVSVSSGDLEVGSTGGLNFETNSGTMRVMTLDTVGNVGMGTTTFGTSAARVLAIAGSTAPTTAITDGIQLFAVDQAGSHELRVMDEAGNTTTLSPHNFSVIGDKSEELAWSFYSQRNSLAINADMTKALRIVEKLSGEKLIYLKDLTTGNMLEDESDATKLTELADNGTIGDIAKWNYQLWTFVGEVIFEKPVKFLAGITVNGKAIFTTEAWFGGRVTFADKDMAGFAQIPAGGQEVVVTFAKSFAQKPVVTITPEESNVVFTLQNVTSQGFTIRLEQVTNAIISFNWIALAVEQPQTVIGQPVNQVEVSPQPSSSPTPQPSLTPTPSATPKPSQSPSPVPSPETSPSSEGTQSATLGI